jgi:ABC-type glycerol-3-phosphate transport system substrate-binding protein
VVSSKKLMSLALTVIVAAALAAGCAKPKKVSIVAYYPLTADHQFIADYLKSLETKPEFQGKITVEINDMQSSEGREKWKTTGLGCAGVFINGKTRWEGLRDGQKETVDFIKRMDSFWYPADFEAVLKQQLADPTKTAVLPPAPAKPKPEAKPETEGEKQPEAEQPAEGAEKPAEAKTESGK